ARSRKIGRGCRIEVTMLSPMLLTVALLMGQTPPTTTPGPALATGPRIYTPLKGTAGEGGTPPQAQTTPSGLPSLVVPTPVAGPLAYDWTAAGSSGSANGNGPTGSNGATKGNGNGDSKDAAKGNGNGDSKDAKKDKAEEDDSHRHFFGRFFKAYCDEFKKKD